MKFESCDYSAEAENGVTRIYDDDGGEHFMILKVDYEIESKEELDGLICAYKIGLNIGIRRGKMEIIDSIHELLGIDKITRAIAEGVNR